MFFLSQVARVGDRPQRGEQLGLDDGARDEQGCVKVHLEGDRPAGDQGHAAVLPVFIGRILNYGPALQERLVLFFFRQDKAVTGLPNGVLDHVADLHLALAVAHEVDTYGFLLGVVRLDQCLQRLLEFTVHDRVEEAHPLPL